MPKVIKGTGTGPVFRLNVKPVIIFITREVPDGTRIFSQFVKVGRCTVQKYKNLHNIHIHVSDAHDV